MVIVTYEDELRLLMGLVWLVVEPPPLNNMKVMTGTMKFPTEWKKQMMFQTTNQYEMS